MLFYRYTVWKGSKNLGGIFRGLEKVVNFLKTFEYDSDENIAYDYIRLKLDSLEEMLWSPYLKEYPNVLWYYTEQGNSLVKTTICYIDEVIRKYNFCVKVEVLDNLDRIIFSE